MDVPPFEANGSFYLTCLFRADRATTQAALGRSKAALEATMVEQVRLTAKQTHATAEQTPVMANQTHPEMTYDSGHMATCVASQQSNGRGNILVATQDIPRHHIIAEYGGVFIDTCDATTLPVSSMSCRRAACGDACVACNEYRKLTELASGSVASAQWSRLVQRYEEYVACERGQYLLRTWSGRYIDGRNESHDTPWRDVAASFANSAQPPDVWLPDACVPCVGQNAEFIAFDGHERSFLVSICDVRRGEEVCAGYQWCAASPVVPTHVVPRTEFNPTHPYQH